MKITDLDKRRAIKRLPEYQDDYARYKGLKTEDEQSQFCYNFYKKWNYELSQIIHADEVSAHRNDAPTVEVVTRLDDDPYIFTYTGEEKIPAHLFGDSLYLKVSLKGKTEKQLIEDFKAAIKPYRDYLNKLTATNERNRKTDIPEGIWPVYDLYLETGRNKLETTRRWFNLSGNPIYNDWEHCLQQIKTAISNAEAIINTVRTEYGLDKKDF